MTDTLALDFTHAARALRRGPMATAIAMLTLALGVGANTAVLSVFESILVRPLPYPRADRLVAVAQADGMRAGDISPWVARTIEEQSTTIDAVGLYTDGQWVMTGEGDAEVFRGQRVSAGFFETLGVRPLLGRVFTRDEDGAPRASVVVLTSELWTTRFGADPGVVGRLVTLNGSPYRIIGVLGREFEPLRMTNPAEEPRIFAPLGYNAVAAAQCRNCASLHGVARLAGDASPARARAELAGMFRRLHDQYPADFGPDAGMQIEPLKDRLAGPLRTALWLALAAGACVLLIAFANLAGLLLARASARTAEFALRGA